MKQSLLLIIFIAVFCKVGNSQPATKKEALQAINDLIKETEEASGFHSLDLIGYRKLGDRQKSIADENGIHFEEEKGDDKIDQYYKFADLKKVVILEGEKAKYGPSYFGDHQMLLHFKQVGRLIIIGISAENVKSFEKAIRFLAPKIKKINYVS